jgi:hypothetical protein
MPEEKKLVPKGSDGPAAREWDRSSAGVPPGERTTSLSQVSPLDPGSLMRVFGGLHRRVQQSLLDMLLPGEEPRVVVPGAAGSAIVATDTRALVLKAGTRFGAPFGERTKAFEYESVIGIRLDTETSPAVVAIDAPHKIASCRVYWADARDDPWKARNAIPVEASSFGMVLEKVVELRALVLAFRESHPNLPQHPEPAHAAPQVLPLPVLTGRCHHCRAELRPGWRFCPGCGAASEVPNSGA